MLSHYHSAIDPEVENDSHSCMLRMVGFNKRVLEAGCASGHMSEMLHARACSVVGIEIDKVVAQSAAPGVERVVMARQEWARLEAAVADLPAGCRTVLLLRKAEHLSHEEIGLQLGIAVSTVEKQHARALRLLRAALQDENTAFSRKNQEARGCAAGR